MRKEVEDLKIFGKQIESCNKNKLDFIQQYRKKEFFFDVSVCDWVRTCETES